MKFCYRQSKHRKFVSWRITSLRHLLFPSLLMSASRFGRFMRLTESWCFQKQLMLSFQSKAIILYQLRCILIKYYLIFSWLNHIMHTNIMIFIVLELFTSFRLYPRRLTGLGGLSIFMASYLVWLHVIKYKANLWVYPILEVLNLPQRIIFFALSLIFSIGLYIFGEFINDQIWVKEIKQATKIASKKH